MAHYNLTERKENVGLMTQVTESACRCIYFLEGKKKKHHNAHNKYYSAFLEGSWEFYLSD